MKESMEGRENSLSHSYNKEIVVIGKLSATVAWIGTTHDNIYFISFSIHLKQE